jgi:TetR/AcrR family transcriptional regulator, cholesterol catabolism regulator
MDDIARLAGVSKKKLYELFTDKDDLVHAAVVYMIDCHQTMFDKTMQAEVNAIEQLISIISIMQEMVHGMNLVCFMDLQRYYPRAFQYLENHRHKTMLNDITTNLKQGIEEGLYREDINVDIISAFRMESVMMIFHTSLYKQNKYDIVKVNNELFAHYMYGIASVKGHKLINKYLNPPSKK